MVETCQFAIGACLGTRAQDPVERRLGHDRVDEPAIEGLGGFAQGLERQAAVDFGLLDRRDARWCGAHPRGHLAGGHAETIANGTKPPPRRSGRRPLARGRKALFQVLACQGAGTHAHALMTNSIALDHIFMSMTPIQDHIYMITRPPRAPSPRGYGMPTPTRTPPQ